jgi:hypothetical protein
MASVKVMRCRHCGTDVRTDYRAKWATCEACKADTQREKDRAKYLKLRDSKQDKVYPVLVVRDPDEIGGFPTGAQFSDQDYRIMLGAKCWTIGTVLQVHGMTVRVERVGNMYMSVPVGG